MNYETDPFTLKVTMTAEDVALGHQGNSQRCPLALALRRALQEQHPQAHPAMLYTYEHYAVYRNVSFNHAHLPQHVTEWIEQFDKAEDLSVAWAMKPLAEFEISFHVHSMDDHNDEDQHPATSSTSDA